MLDLYHTCNDALTRSAERLGTTTRYLDQLEAASRSGHLPTADQLRLLSDALKMELGRIADVQQTLSRS